MSTDPSVEFDRLLRGLGDGQITPAEADRQYGQLIKRLGRDEWFRTDDNPEEGGKSSGEQR